MKGDLDILIAHVQEEYDVLLSSMEKCIAVWDFETAKLLRRSIHEARRKLNILKCLQNPNFQKMDDLVQRISNLEQRMTDKTESSAFDFLDDEMQQHVQEIFAQLTQRSIHFFRNQLEELRLIVPEEKGDDDKILELLEGVERNEIRQLTFEIKKDKIYLQLRVEKDTAEFTFISSSGKVLDHYLNQAAKSILISLGYDRERHKKIVSGFSQLDKQKVLEELAIIYFEVFELWGEDRQVRIDLN